MAKENSATVQGASSSRSSSRMGQRNAWLNDNMRSDTDTLLMRFEASRQHSEVLAAAFSPEDWMLQSMEAASPIKWNLAHTSWFYETFILAKFSTDYKTFDPVFSYLFNSYYNQVGDMQPRARRCMLSRPSAETVIAYRHHVTEGVTDLYLNGDKDLRRRLHPLLALGIAHEEQHQELLLTDVQHALSENITSPSIFSNVSTGSVLPRDVPISWCAFEGGCFEIGHSPTDDDCRDYFAFDNEGPRHKVVLQPFALADRLVTNADYLRFMEEGGYDDPRWWLADGWALMRAEGWRAPLYWRDSETGWNAYSLYGENPINPDAPVCHLSFYEAAAYAEWTGFRLPSEAEWEVGAAAQPVSGNFLENGQVIQPQPASGSSEGAAQDGPQQMFGDVWEWTASPYIAYPGFRTPPGAIGEYNGKFMSSQMVLRGGSCATPVDHLRATYRNFFPPDARWQFTGLRLARDLD